MTQRGPTMHLTWAGFEAAVDLIAAQCRRHDRPGIYAMQPAGQVLAIAQPSAVRAWIR